MDNRTVASAHSQIEKVKANLTTHEAVCAERYEMLRSRLQRLEIVVISTAGASLLLLVSLVLQL
jgi:hypothetical protein